MESTSASTAREAATLEMSADSASASIISDLFTLVPLVCIYGLISLLARLSFSYRCSRAQFIHPAFGTVKQRGGIHAASVRFTRIITLFNVRWELHSDEMRCRSARRTKRNRRP